MKRRHNRPRVNRSTFAELDEHHGVQVARRRAAATRLVDPASRAAVRVSTAPPGYLLAHDPSDIARHAALLATLPSPGEVRLVASPGPARNQWSLDVASRDRPGLLAAFTGVFANAGIHVTQGVVATWDDGGALQAFMISASRPPDTDLLQTELERSLGTPLVSPAVIDANVTFENALGLYTSCDVVAADRPGLLHAIAVAISAAGAIVHAARVTTTANQARDRFDLSDRVGQKLGTPQQAAIRALIISGATGVPRGRPLQARRGQTESAFTANDAANPAGASG